MSIDAATDTDVFIAYVTQVLVPSLREGDIVILDNLSAHKSAAVEEAIRSAGARVEYLPANSPDLNPIEKMRSTIKAFLRAVKARTSRSLNAAIRKTFRCITPDDAVSRVASCGYTFN